jgi:outer membrane protein TolC
VAASRQDLANSEGFVEQRELILKSVLSRRGTADPDLARVRIVPTDPITVPATEVVRPVQDLVNEAFQSRPELEAARLQIVNSQISLEGSRNAQLPEIDLVANAGVAGLAGQANPYAVAGTGTSLLPAGIDAANLGGIWTSLGQLFRANYPTYGVGVQINLPLRNRAAEADVARDTLQVRQSEVRQQQLSNQVRLEVESALVVLNRARAALDAAVQTRTLQEQSLEIEKEKYDVGLSTVFLISQYQSFLAQARSTEVAARSTYVKARTALERAIGATLKNHGVSISEAYSGHVPRSPDAIPAVPPQP